MSSRIFLASRDCPEYRISMRTLKSKPLARYLKNVAAAKHFWKRASRAII
jgi:hypothetical protein